MYQTPTPITNRTTPTFVMTSTALVVALSRMPMTRMTVEAAMMSTAGKLNQAPSLENGSEARKSGTWGMCTAFRKTLKYFVQSAARTPQLMAYSRIRSQPMIQANSSPSVA